MTCAEARFPDDFKSSSRTPASQAPTSLSPLSLHHQSSLATIRLYAHHIHQWRFAALLYQLACADSIPESHHSQIFNHRSSPLPACLHRLDARVSSSQSHKLPANINSTASLQTPFSATPCFDSSIIFESTLLLKPTPPVPFSCFEEFFFFSSHPQNVERTSTLEDFLCSKPPSFSSQATLSSPFYSLDFTRRI